MNASHESKNSLLMSQFMHKGAKNKNTVFKFTTYTGDKVQFQFLGNFTHRDWIHQGK